MSYGKRAGLDTLREVAFGSITNAYAVLGSATTKLINIIKFTNSTDAIIYITADNSLDQIKMLPNSFLLLDVTAAKAVADGPIFIEIGTQYYLKYSADAPTEGACTIEALIIK